MLKEIPKAIIPDGSVEMESMEWAGQRRCVGHSSALCLVVMSVCGVSSVVP